VLDVATGPQVLSLKLEIQARLYGFHGLHLSLFQSTNVLCNFTKKKRREKKKIIFYLQIFGVEA